MSEVPLPHKPDVANFLLTTASVLINLDPRHDSVVAPPWLKHQAQLVLEFGYSMGIDIPDLKVSDTGISGTLSFSRTPYFCSIPWDSVFAIVGKEGRGIIWPESMPKEIVDEVRSLESKDSSDSVVTRLKPKKKTQTKAARPLWESTTDPAPPVTKLQSELRRLTDPAPSEKLQPGAKAKRTLPPYLRVIK